ncbi:MAG: hypothetical protein WCV93_05265 [Candidatus Shapirobacteria bacterium]|jgi:hypothetical protein
MDEIISCPTCHQPVEQTDFFCSTCGKNLHPVPPSTSLSSQIVLYLKTLLLPPFGFIWSYRYLRQSDSKSKLIGLFTIVITVIEIIWLIQSTSGLINTVNQQISQQQELYGL